MASAPDKERINKYFTLPCPILNSVFDCIKLKTAITRAKKLRKKHFCNVGTSPDKRMNKFMTAKQNAEQIIKKIPNVFLVFLLVVNIMPSSC